MTVLKFVRSGCLGETIKLPLQNIDVSLSLHRNATTLVSDATHYHRESTHRIEKNPQSMTQMTFQGSNPEI